MSVAYSWIGPNRDWCRDREEAVPTQTEGERIMSLKLKVLGLGLLAVMATSAFAVTNAGATLGGHFTNDALNGHALITGTESTGSSHTLHFKREGAPEEDSITCHNATYHGTVNAATVQSVTITPDWSKCTTNVSGSPTFEVHENGCTLTFTSGKIGQTHHTVDVVCPPGKSIEITHELCTMRMPGGQTLRGITYTTTTESNKHALTMNVTVKGITSHYEAGICVFLGTTQKSEMNGSVTIKATNTAGEAVNITETTG
jgi:hypothetical protein